MEMEGMTKEDRTCRTCEHWVCMNHKDLIGACTIWHDSGKTWPKSYDCCQHHKEIIHKGGEADAEKR